VVAAVYILWLYQRMMTGVPSEEVAETVTEISRRELIAIAPVLAIIIALGFAPQFALNLINPAVEQIQTYVGVVDPESAVNLEGSGS
jgi:NADH-quinone oxidoreductase subunit M